MRNDRRIRDAKIRNGRPTKQEKIRMEVDSTKTFEEAHAEAVEKVKRYCLTCGNAEHEEDGITCLLHNWYFNTNVARVSGCTNWEKGDEEQ